MNMTQGGVRVGVGLAAALAVFGCEEKDGSGSAEAELASMQKGQPAAAVTATVAPEARKEFNPRLLRRFKPARAVIEGESGADTQARIELGRMLYHEKRISKGEQVSCNSCHSLENYGVDGRKTSVGF